MPHLFSFVFSRTENPKNKLKKLVASFFRGCRCRFSFLRNIIFQLVNKRQNIFGKDFVLGKLHQYQAAEKKLASVCNFASLRKTIFCPNG
jgi:hypothetical protein